MTKHKAPSSLVLVRLETNMELIKDEDDDQLPGDVDD